MFATGALYGGGHDVAPNRALAQQWFLKAAERGHAFAQMMLGRYLARSLAGEQSLSKARFWFDQARSRGVTEVDLAALDAHEAQQAQSASAAD